MKPRSLANFGAASFFVQHIYLYIDVYIWTGFQDRMTKRFDNKLRPLKGVVASLSSCLTTFVHLVVSPGRHVLESEA